MKLLIIYKRAELYRVHSNFLIKKINQLTQNEICSEFPLLMRCNTLFTNNSSLEVYNIYYRFIKNISYLRVKKVFGSKILYCI